MILRKGWNQQVMASLYKVESAYNAGVVMNATNACSFKGAEVTVEWDDKVNNDKDSITGYEFGTDQQYTGSGIKINYKEARAKPNSIIGFAALCMGALSVTQDGGYLAFRNKITRGSTTAALPSIQFEEKLGDIQFAYTGVKGNSFKLSGEAGEFIGLECNMIGSGSRAISTTPFVPAIDENWLKTAQTKVWMEQDSNISIAATLTQGMENISSATPDDLSIRMKSFEFAWDNNCEGVIGFGGGGLLQDIDKVRRSASLKFTLLAQTGAELDYFLNQNVCALELNCKTSQLIATGGTLYYGMTLIIPRFKLKKAPKEAGGVNDTLTCEFECDIQDDGVNSPVILESYNTKATYMSA